MTRSIKSFFCSITVQRITVTGKITVEVTSSKRYMGYGKRLGAVLPVTVVMPFIYFQFANIRQFDNCPLFGTIFDEHEMNQKKAEATFKAV